MSPWYHLTTVSGDTMETFNACCNFSVIAKELSSYFVIICFLVRQIIILLYSYYSSGTCISFLSQWQLEITISTFRSDLIPHMIYILRYQKIVMFCYSLRCFFTVIKLIKIILRVINHLIKLNYTVTQ